MNEILESIAGLPPILIYLVIGVGAAIENFVPPVPADTFVLLGAFLTTMGRANPWVVFLVTWVFNVSAAAFVYHVARKYGGAFFKTRIGRLLLNEKQLDQVGSFYRNWGSVAILGSRFLPAFRAIVPVFAGVSHLPFVKMIVPMALASAAWYGGLVYLGAKVGRNWEQIMAWSERSSTVLAIIAAVLVIVVAGWWWRSRRAHH